MKKWMSIFVLFFFVACKSSEPDLVSSEYYYTCSMHPQIVENKPGLCPICHMDLIKVKRTQSAPDEITLSPEQIRLANIVSTTIVEGDVATKNIFTGIITEDESRTNAVTSWISGRIDRLYYKNTSDYVARGAPVFSIFSEELRNAQQEYLSAVEKKNTLDNNIIDFDRIIEGAAQKLLTMGQTRAQIESLRKEGKAPGLTTYYSPASGVIIDLPVLEGDYVQAGGMVMKLADYSSLWIQAQVYPNQLASLREGDNVQIEFPDLAGLKLPGKIAFISPEIMPDSRLSQVRIEVSNRNGKLRPGMAAYVTFQRPVSKTPVLPLDAVIRDNDKNIVWVQTGDENFKWKEVKLGEESNHQVAVLSGLDPEDKVVVSGVYLLNSEYLLKKGLSGE
ncbi:MAG: efflux RND transporter periplasmic adaptor subunit [Chitinophagaceae bacterium]|nr:efflux RND transporter periplasmic adaptor subunit [Chitinophagaceae bacterium]